MVSGRPWSSRRQFSLCREVDPESDHGRLSADCIPSIWVARPSLKGVLRSTTLCPAEQNWIQLVFIENLPYARHCPVVLYPLPYLILPATFWRKRHSAICKFTNSWTRFFIAVNMSVAKAHFRWVSQGVWEHLQYEHHLCLSSAAGIATTTYRRRELRQNPTKVFFKTNYQIWMKRTTSSPQEFAVITEQTDHSYHANKHSHFGERPLKLATLIPSSKSGFLSIVF